MIFLGSPYRQNQLPLYESDDYTPRDIGFDGPYDVYSTHGKRPRGGHDIQGMWRSIDIFCERLTIMAFPYMDAAITFHGEP